MAEIILDKSKTALLMADFATSGIGQNPVAEERHTLERAKDVLDAARNPDGNPDSPQVVVFSATIVDVTVGY